MGVIQGVLREELSNSLRMKKDYERELTALPKGSLIQKKIRGHKYSYLVLREKGRVRFIYKGKPDPRLIKKFHEIKEYRAKYRKLLSEVKEQVRFIERSLRGKGPDLES